MRKHIKEKEKLMSTTLYETLNIIQDLLAFLLVVVAWYAIKNRDGKIPQPAHFLILIVLGINLVQVLFGGFWFHWVMSALWTILIILEIIKNSSDVTKFNSKIGVFVRHKEGLYYLINVYGYYLQKGSIFKPANFGHLGNAISRTNEDAIITVGNIRNLKIDWN